MFEMCEPLLHRVCAPIGEFIVTAQLHHHFCQPISICLTLPASWLTLAWYVLDNYLPSSKKALTSDSQANVKQMTCTWQCLIVRCFELPSMWFSSTWLTWQGRTKQLGGRVKQIEIARRKWWCRSLILGKHCVIKDEL